MVPLRLQLAEGQGRIGLWIEFVARHHYLGYSQPRGPHLRYFLLDRHDRKLGCLLFSRATVALHCRDRWIGWRKGEYNKQLDLVVGQPRCLLFPWDRVHCLASKTLSMAVRQLPKDWQQRYNTRPVLLETFVDLQRFSGVCYRAANWERVGRTKGRVDAGRSRKDVYVYPLARHCREILRHGPRPKPRRRPPPRVQQAALDADFAALWQGLIGSLSAIAVAQDRCWQQRNRSLNALLVMLFVFRVVFAPRRQGYAAVLVALWAQCRALGAPLPQPQPVSDAAVCKARPKVDEAVFQQFHAEILQRGDQPGPTWQGHRVFAVVGSKLNLQRQLTDAGYATSSANAHYPQGLLSCLFRLQSKLPVDSDSLRARCGNERTAALAHFQALAAPDLVL